MTTPKSSTEPMDVFHRFEVSLNRSDMDTGLAVFADDGVLVGGPSCTPTNPCVGKQAVKDRFLGYLAKANFTSSVIEESQEGDTVHATVEVTTDQIRAKGISRIRGHDTVQVTDGKIRSFVFKPDATDPLTARYLATLPPAR